MSIASTATGILQIDAVVVVIRGIPSAGTSTMIPDNDTARLLLQLNDANARAESAAAQLPNRRDEQIEIADLKKRLSAREALLRDIYSSASWKLLRPVRMMKKAAHVVRHAFGRLLHTPLRSGALRSKSNELDIQVIATSPPNKQQTSKGTPHTLYVIPEGARTQEANYITAIEADRQRLGFEQLRQQSRQSGPAMLFVTLGRGGGTERHVQEMRSALEAQGTPVFVLRSSPKDHGSLRFDVSNDKSFLSPPPITVPDDLDLLVYAIKSLNVKHIHVQHLADAGSGAETMFQNAADMCGIAYDVTVHDYMFICPRFTLIGESGVYCGEPDDRACNVCFRLYSPMKHSTITEWRTRYGVFLAEARSVFVPNVDVLNRMRNYFPQVHFTLRPHFTKIGTPPFLPGTKQGERRVAVIGAIRRHKGSQIVLECAKHAASQRTDIKFIVIGYTSNDEELRALPNVTITGAYDEKNIHNLIHDYEPDVAWFPSVCPETFSYTLSTAAEARIFPITFDLGACAERIRALGWGAIMPLDYMLSPPRIVEFLLSTPIAAPPDNIASAMDVSYNSMLAEYYELELIEATDERVPCVEASVPTLPGLRARPEKG